MKITKYFHQIANPPVRFRRHGPNSLQVRLTRIYQLAHEAESFMRGHKPTRQFRTEAIASLKRIEKDLQSLTRKIMGEE